MSSESRGTRPPSLLALPSYLASQVSRFGRRQLAVALARHDLHLVHHAILSALSDFGPLSQQQLADCLDLDKSHLVGRIDHLEDRGLIRRAPDPADRRRYRVTLLPAGRRLVNQLRPDAVQSQQSFLQALTADEQQTLETLLRKVLAANDHTRLHGPAGGAPLPPYTPDDDQAPPV